MPGHNPIWPVIFLCSGAAAQAQSPQPAAAARRAAEAFAPGAAQGSGAVVKSVGGRAEAAGTDPGTPPHAPRVQGLVLEAGTGRIVVLNAPAATVFAADPKVADVRPASPTSLFILGVAPGRTTIAVVGDNGAAIAQYDIVVNPSSLAAAQAESAIARRLHGQDVRVETRANGLVVSGSTRTAADADLAMRTAQEFTGPGQTVASQLSVQGGQQVNLRVRIAEMSRNVVRKLGVNWSALGNIGTVGTFAAYPALALNVNANSLTGIAPAGNPLNLGGNINGVIDALAQDNLVHVLAEPNLTAMSGETASFLVGGEFPIPISQQNNQVTIEFKQYGVSLAFVPTVMSGGRINMKVRPEVSALTTQGAVQIGAGNNSIQVPALTVRRAETTVELASGQSFAIAGLLQDSTSLSGNAIPGIGELPVIGALFRSDAFQRNETELVIVITPYLVNGVSATAQVRLPTDGWSPPGDVDRLLRLRQSARDPRAADAMPRVPGAAGFIIQ